MTRPITPPADAGAGMIGMSVCSGIGAPEYAAPWIDWKYQSEIEPFPAAVLKARFPEAENLGDMTQFQEWPDATVDVLCGGTPCQAFSIAGLRQGLADPRGNLMLTYLAIAARYRPRWLVFENVPGMFSATSHDAPDPCPPGDNLDGDDGPEDGTEVVVEDEYEADETHAFACFLAGLSELGYGFAYRVLDVQFTRTRSFPRAIPQRRRRVFVVGYSGDWRRAAAVLFDAESLSGNPPPRREAGQGAAGDAGAGAGSRRTIDPGFGVCGALSDGAHMGGGLNGQDAYTGRVLPVAQPVTHALTGEGFDAFEDGTGRGTPLVPVAYRTTGNAGVYETGDKVDALTTATDPNSHVIAFGSKDHGADAQDGVSPTLRAGGHDGSHQNAGVPPAVAFDTYNADLTGDVTHTLRDGNSEGTPAITTPWAVRRLTPVECERLQGFPDGWTAIPWRGKPADQCPDGPRYKAIGNSWGVNCGEWIFDRIRMVEELP